MTELSEIGLWLISFFAITEVEQIALITNVAAGANLNCRVFIYNLFFISIEIPPSLS
jgi:hypothetical protein